MSLLTFSKAKIDDCNKEDLKNIILQSINFIRKELNILSIEIVTHFDEVPLIEVSLSKIQQLLLNLFINAKHAIGSDGVLTIALLNKVDFVEIRIGDTGGGIKKEHLNKIFDPFFSTKGVWGEDRVPGSGIGLSICRNFARDHNGDLQVETVEGVGSVFTVSLPVSKETEISSNLFIKNEQNILFFTLDHSLIMNYFDDACDAHLQLLMVDNFDKIYSTLFEKTTFVVCDAKFSGKIELCRMVEFCIKHKQPYVMVNCGAMEYQLDKLYENSLANYKELPEFHKLINDFSEEVKRVDMNKEFH